MSIRELTKELNEKASEYEIGNLQEIRKEIKGLKRRPGSKIFREDDSIFENYAFHHGGRKEIQFNIGFENDLFRYGLAFSLERSQTLPEPEILYPKIRKLNNIFRESRDYFSDYLLWYVDEEGKRSERKNMSEIPTEFVAPESFIFFGKLVKVKEINVKEILSEFDRLLPIYKAVETDGDIGLAAKSKEENEFVFNKENRDLDFTREYSSVEKQIDLDVRHSVIQAKLQERLEEEYGEESVSLENPVNGNRIDAVVKKNEDYIFYEVKTASTVKNCIRQAIGQLLEYGFLARPEDASKLVVVGEPDINEKSRKYLTFLNDELNIPIEYLSIDISE